MLWTLIGVTQVLVNRGYRAEFRGDGAYLPGTTTAGLVLIRTPGALS